jgi:hypothetical protein
MKHDELAYYRAVEDHFARLRGTPFLFTPKDFGLLRGWWSEGVPLAAVLAGVGEVMARRTERGQDPVSSLSYCRHAVTRHAKRLASARVGGAAVPAALSRYASLVRVAAERCADEARAAEALAALADAVESLPVDAPVAALDATVASVEATALEAAVAALAPARRRQLEAEVEAAVLEAGGGPTAAPGVRRAFAVKAARQLFGVPRLEIDSDAPES